MDRPIFGYDYNGQNVEWTWRVREVEKIYWKTWKPKLSDVKILNLTDSNEVSKVQQEIFQGVMDSEHPKKDNETYKRQNNCLHPLSNEGIRARRT